MGIHHVMLVVRDIRMDGDALIKHRLQAIVHKNGSERERLQIDGPWASHDKPAYLALGSVTFAAVNPTHKTPLFPSSAPDDIYSISKGTAIVQFMDSVLEVLEHPESGYKVRRMKKTELLKDD